MNEGAMWSAYILPYMEADNIRKLVEINYGSNVNYAYPNPFYTYPVANNNLQACETVIPVYRCPSTDQPEHIADQGADAAYYIQARVPGSYIGCASGVAINSWRTEYADGERHDWMEQLDGVLTGVQVNLDVNPKFSREPISMKMIVDGTSNTVAVGEAVSDINAIQNSAGSNGYSAVETRVGNRKDHWYIGSDSIDGPSVADLSEAMGSTGVPLNLHKQPALFNCAGSASGNACQALQLSFSSEHPGIVQVVMSDGSVQTIQEDIDSEVWSKQGTRSAEYDRLAAPTLP